MRTENIYSVYVHKNLKNDKYYVGSTKQNPKERWRGGWGYKNNSKMWSDIQNSDWNKDWVHGILGKFTDKNEALKYEAFLIAMLNSAREGYNISTFSSNPTEETKRKLSEAKIGENNPMYGKHHSEESRRMMSELKIGRTLTEEHRKKIRENHPSKAVIQFSKNGEFIAEYNSVMEAERQTGCYNPNIIKCCKGKRKSCGGYLWKYKNGGLN